MGSAGNHDVCLAVSDEHGGFSDGLGTGGAGGQAAADDAACSRQNGQMSRRHVGFLLEFMFGGHHCKGGIRPGGPIHLLILTVPALEDCRKKCVAVHGPFAGAQIDAHASSVDAVGWAVGFCFNAGLTAGLFGGS